MKSLFGGSAVIAAAILSSAFILSATPSAAETPGTPPQQKKQQPKLTGGSETREQLAGSKSDPRQQASNPEQTHPAETPGGSESGVITGVITEATDPAGGLTARSVPDSRPLTYTATAYSLGGRTASGQPVAKGLIAADPARLPLGTRVRLEAGSYSGEYLVADTGGSVKGNRIDIWTPTSHEANRFGRRTVKLTVLSYPVKRRPRRSRG